MDSNAVNWGSRSMVFFCRNEKLRRMNRAFSDRVCLGMITLSPKSAQIALDIRTAEIYN